MLLDPYDSLGFHCSLTYRAFVNALEKRLAKTGVRPAQWVALAHLIALGPIPQRELSKALSITGATTARLVDRMERDGWALRKPDSTDARVKLVEPTAEARKMWKQLSVIGRDLLQQAYQGTSPEEIESVKRTLERLRRNLGE